MKNDKSMGTRVLKGLGPGHPSGPGVLGHLRGLGPRNVIAVALRTPTAQAEDIKQKYGCAAAELTQDGETLEVMRVGGRPPRADPCLLPRPTSGRRRRFLQIPRSSRNSGIAREIPLFSSKFLEVRGIPHNSSRNSSIFIQIRGI